MHQHRRMLKIDKGIKATMNITHTVLLSSALLITSPLFAETQTAKSVPAYGDNPNIFKVLAVKAQNSVQSTADKVGAATERGIAKIKPGLDNTWNGTKEYTTEQAVLARDNTREGIDTAVKKVKQTKANMVGESETNTVAIERGSLSQVNPPAVPPYLTQRIDNDSTTTSKQANIQKVAPSQISITSDAEIQRHPIPVQSTPAQPIHSNDDADPGLPR